MSDQIASVSLQRGQRTQASVPSFCLLTGMLVLMSLVLAGGMIYYQFASLALGNGVRADDLAFASRIEALAGRVVSTVLVRPDLQEEVDAEMAQRPVVKVIVYDNYHLIRFSTNPSEHGRSMDLADLRPNRSSLIHYETFKTGDTILRDRDLVTTNVVVRRQSGQSLAYIVIYTDMTESIRDLVRVDILVVAWIELMLAAVLAVLLYRSRHKKVSAADS